MKRTFLAILLVVSLSAGAVAGQPAIATQDAQLDIREPNWADGTVETDTSGNVTTFKAQGGRLYISPENFDGANVSDYTAGQGANLTYDRDLGVYVFRAGADGTYDVSWTVPEQREVVRNNSTSVEQVSVKYSAKIRASETGATVVGAGELKSLKQKSENWEQFNQSLHDPRVGGDRPTDELTQLAIDLVRVRFNPAAVFTGQVGLTLTILVLRLGGMIVVSTALLLHLASRFMDIRQRRKQQTLDAERADLETMVENLKDLQQQENLAKWDWNRWMPDQDARAFREALDENPHKGWRKLCHLFSPRTLLRDRLAQMGSAGHVAVVDERRATDGGDGDGVAQPASAHVKPRGETPETTDEEDVIKLDDPDNLTDPLLHAIGGDDPEVRAFDPVAADTDGLAGIPMEAPDIDDLIQEYEISLQRDFGGDKGLLLRYMREFVESVEQSPYVDVDGSPDTVEQTMQTLIDLCDQLRDREDIPLAGWLADSFELMDSEYSRVDEIDDYVNEVKDGTAS